MVEVRGVKGRLTWVGDPGVGGLAVFWAEGDSICDSFALHFLAQNLAEEDAEREAKKIAASIPGPRAVTRAHPRCKLGNPPRSPRTVVVYLIKRPGLPKTAFVPVTRHIGITDQKAPLGATLRQLARGTTLRERRAGCMSYFDSTRPRVIRDLALEGDELTIDFKGNAMFALGATTATSFFLGQLKRTVFEFPEVNSIRLQLDGSCKRFGNAIQTLRCVTIMRDDS